MRNFLKPTMTIAALAAGTFGANAANLVQNGDFEQNGGLGQIASNLGSNITTLSDWSITDISDPGSQGFAFVLNAQGDSVGFASIFSAAAGGTHITVWGPNTASIYPGTGPVTAAPVNNGWTGSPDGGDFVGIDVDYGKSSMSQTVSGLTVGQTYTLSFDWAGAQFAGYAGATTEGWNVDFGGDTATTGTVSNVTEGFTGWMNYSTTFTANAASELLTFTPTGSGPNLPPFALIDGVSLTENTPVTPPGGPVTPAVPEASTWAMFLIGFASVGYAGYRSARRKAAAA